MNFLLHDWKNEMYIAGDDTIRDHARRLRDTNPLHHDAEAAKKLQGVAGIILPGLVPLAAVISAIAEKIPGVAIRKLSVEFLSPVYAQTRLTLSFKVASQKRRRVEASIAVMNDDVAVMTAGCILWLPAMVQESIAA